MAEGPVAVCERKASASDEVLKTLSCHCLQQSVLVRVMQVECGPVQGSFAGDLLNRDIFKLFFIQ
jgi:hypothetical protein